MNFSPWTASPRPCWHCSSFVVMLYEGSVAQCKLPGGPRVRPMPMHGCSAWQREVGADDEPGPPDGQPVTVTRMSAERSP